MKHTLQQLIPSSRPIQILLIGLVVMLLLITTRSKTPAVTPQERAWIVNTQTIQLESLHPIVALFGQVQSPQDADLSAGIEAIVSEVIVRDGDSVIAGDILAKLDDRDARLNLAEYEANLKEVEAQLKLSLLRFKRAEQDYQKELQLLKITNDRFKRSQNLLKKKVLSQNDFESSREQLTRQELAASNAELQVEENNTNRIELEAKLARLTAQRDKAVLDVERATINAPFDGVISELTISQGDRVRFGDTLMRLQNPLAIEIRAQIPSRYARSMRDSLNNNESITATVYNGRETINGLVLRVSGQTRENSGGVDSFIGFKEAPLGLSLGSTVRVELELPAQPLVAAIPAEAIYGNDQVYRIVDQRMEMLTVERVGETRMKAGKTQILIRSNQLNNNDQIITTKLSNASNGLLVSVASANQDMMATTNETAIGKNTAL